MHLIKQTIGCSKGCIQCSLQNVCSQCEDNYQLDPDLGVCVYQGCLPYLFLQEKINQIQGVCQAVCDQGYKGDNITSLCVNLNQCSLTFSSQTGISQVNELIKYVLQYEEQYFFIVYSSYISKLQKNTGRFMQSIPFQQNIEYAQLHQGIFYIFQNDNKVSRWNYQNNSTALFNFALQGNINQSTQIISMNDQFGIVITFDRKKQKIYATLLLDQENQNFVEKLSELQINQISNQGYYFFSDLLLITSLNGIEALQLFLDKDNNLNTKQYSNGYSCQNVNSQNILKVIKYNQSNIIILSDQTFFLILDQTSCQITQIPQPCSQIKNVSYSSSPQQQSNLYLFQLQTLILVLDENLTKVAQIEIQANAIDFLCLTISEQDMICSVLDNAPQLNFFKLNLKKNFKSLLIYSFKLNNFNPTNLALINKLTDNSNQLKQIQIIAYSKQIQSLTLNVTNENSLIFVNQYFLKPFQSKSIDMDSSIQSMDTNESRNLATFCSINGQIMTWDYSTIVKPQLFDTNQINNQGQCQRLAYLTDNNVLILFQNSILALDVINSQSIKTWNFVNTQSKMVNQFVLTLNGNSYLMYDSCFKALDQNFQLIFQDCSAFFDDIIISVKLDPSMKLVVQKQNSFSIFQIKNNQLNLKASYQTQSQIQVWKIRNFPDSYQQQNGIIFEIASYFSDQSFILFDQGLNILVTYQNVLLQTAIDISFMTDDPEDNLYVIAGISSQKSASYRYQAFALFKNYTNIFQVTQQSGFNKFFSVYKDVNSANGAIAYTFKAAVALSYLTVVQSFYYNMQNQDNFFSTNYLSPSVYVNVFQTIKQEQFFMIGDKNGLMTVDATRRQIYTNVYNINSQDVNQKDFIQGVYQSLALQKYFIVKSNILVYNLCTNEFIEQLEVQTNPHQPIQYFSIVDSQFSIICFKQNILFLKNYQTNKIYFYSTFNTITNYLVDSNNIYLYGTSISILGFDLVEKVSLKNSQDNSIVQQCCLSYVGLICKRASAITTIFDKQNLNPITTIQQRFLDNNYQLQIDNQNQQIILYSLNIEVYSFNGNFQMYISTVNLQIKEIKILTNDISATSTNIFIFERKTFNYRGQIISPGGGVIQRTYFIAELNQLVFHVNVIRFAQVFTISLDTLLTIMQYKNSFSQNQPSVSVNYLYDKDQNLFVLLDQTGSFQTIDYQGQYITWTTTKFVEYNQFSLYSFVGFSLDFQNNNLLVYSQTQVFSLCYGDLTNKLIQFRTSKKEVFVQIKSIDSTEQDSNNNSFIIAGDQGLLYKYQDTNFEYFYQLSEEILSIKYNQNLKLFIIALSQSLVVFNNLDKNSLNNLSPWLNQPETINLNNRFSSFICEDVFVTKDRQIIHYNFANKSNFKVIQLQDPISRIVKQGCSSVTHNVYLGLSNGDVLIYNRQIFDLQTINLIPKQQGQPYSGLEIGFLAETSTDLWVCFSSSQGIFKINLSNLSFSQIIQFNNLSTYKTFKQLNVMLFDLDEQNGRVFLNFLGEKLLRVFDFKGKLIQYVSLPGVMYNTLIINKSHLLVYCTFHVMIYDRVNLNYISRVRRDNHNDFILDVIEIQNKYFVLLSQNKYELFVIQQNNFEAVLMDQVSLSNPTYMAYSFTNATNQSLNQIMSIILLSSKQVVEQRYNLVYESIQTQNKICRIEVSVSSFYDISFSMSKIKPVSYPDPSQRSMIPVTDYSLNNYWDILLNSNDLRTINFQSTLNSLTQVFPVQSSDLSRNSEYFPLKIYSDSFTSYKKQEIQIRDFSYVFQDNIGLIQFDENSNFITFNNIQITSQVVDNINFQFVDMDKVVFDQIYLKSLQRRSQLINDTQKVCFFNFNRVKTVNIYSLVLDNYNLQDLSFSCLISAINVNKLTISNLTIQNSTIDSLIYIYQTNNLIINNLQIINCNQNPKNQNSYVINLIGIMSSTLKNLNFYENKNLLFINTSNIYKENEIEYVLQIDALNIDSLYFAQNTISYSKNQSLVNAQSSFCAFNNITYQSNQGNFLVTQSKNLVIQNSKFLNNFCLNGGALALIKCQNKITIQNTKLQFNQAFASGGAIYFENVGAVIQMDQNVNINQNSALIGGGIRLFNTDSDLPQNLNFAYQNIIYDNSALLYGKNVGTFLQTTSIGVIQSSQISEDNTSTIDYNIIQNENMNSSNQSKFQQILQIFQFQSGGMLNLFIQLIDSEKTYFKFSINKYNQQLYPDPIMSELKQIQFKIQSYSVNQQILINGHNIITSSDFDDINYRFVFTQIQISSMPNQTTSLVIIPEYTPSNIKVLPIYIEMQMRICRPGEVVKQLENNIFSCFSCPLGSYSMTDPTKDKFWYDQISKTDDNASELVSQQSECQKCPDQAYICQNNTIILKTGYWRENSTSSDIVECSGIFNACDEQDETSQSGCLKGYMGPICKVCDVGGAIWNGQRYSKSFINQLRCDLCNDVNYQLFFIFLAIIILIIYFILSMILFFNSFVHSSVCFYLRQMKFIPISRGSILDQSSFYLKILVNYIQISSVLVSLQVSFFPDFLSSLPNYIGDPNASVIVSINCIVSQNLINLYGQSHVIQVFQALLPIAFLAILLGLVFVFEKLKLFGIRKYHKFTLMNFIFIFFQPDQINFFSKQLTCIQIGSEKYVTSDLLIKCNDSNYNSFTYPLSIPLIIIWGLFPFIIFKLLQKRSHELQKCLTLYYFGYYYQEFKEKFYFWEFIRIYLRVILVVAFTLTSQSQFISYQVVIFILFIYIKFTLYFNPIRNNNLQRFDLFCYQVIILNSLLSTINTETKSYAISGLIYSLHLIFIFMIVLAILFFKINNPLTCLGRCFSRVLKTVLPISIYTKFQKNQKTSWKTYLSWKKIKKNLNLIVQLEALQKVAQEKSIAKLNANYTFDSLTGTKRNQLKQKVSNLILHLNSQGNDNNSSKNKDYAENDTIIKLEKVQSENLKTYDMYPKSDKKSDFYEQSDNYDFSYQLDQFDEVNCKSDRFQSNVYSNVMNSNYENKFKRKISLDIKQLKSQNQVKL